jgi:phosphoglycerate dehydrogenase-like enzyme
MIDAHALSLLPPRAVLGNVARRSLIDEDALYDALISGKLFAAGLDVFREEPACDIRFASLDNVLLAPHVASASKETRDPMGYRALDNITAMPAGRPAIDPPWRD